jgi:hypothetical protein
MCLIEKRRNHNDILNIKLDPHDRAVTFEGLDYMSQSFKVASINISNQVLTTVKRLVDVS